jgi:hypothetical protein
MDKVKFKTTEKPIDSKVVRDWKNGGRCVLVEKITARSLRAAGISGTVYTIVGTEITEEQASEIWSAEEAARNQGPTPDWQ